MKFNYKISRLALEDIDSIWEFTVQNWSIEQAEKYYKEIFMAIDSVCQNPKTGESIKEIKESHRKFLVGSHMIIYQQINDTVLVDRVLHQRMDIKSRLRE